MTKKNSLFVFVLIGIVLFAIGCTKIAEKNCRQKHDYETYDYYVHTGYIVVCKKPYNKTEFGDKIYANFHRLYEEGIYFIPASIDPVISKLPKKYVERDTIYAIIACDRSSYSALQFVNIACIEEIFIDPALINE